MSDTGRTHEIDDLIGRVEQLDRGDHAGRIAGWTEVLARPAATDGGFVDVAGVWDEIHRHRRALGQFDEAIDAKREAIAAGYASTPDPEADIAEIYVEQGRLEEGATLFATLRDRAPDDVWLYNSAAWVYRSVDPAESLRWALAGIDKAFETGDPDQVIGQLRDLAVEAWNETGTAPDVALLERIGTFIDEWTRPPRRWPVPASGAPAPTPLRPRVDPVREPSRAAALGFAWFPPEEWPVAMQRWPHLLDGLPPEYEDYSRKLESKLKAFHKLAGGISLHVSPITVDELVADAAAEGHDPGSSEARSRLAAEVARTGRAVPWPPGRNDRCWCRSGRKYKHCCGPTPPELIEESGDE
ncbi:SEC-C metal-binding domain-containing protein [Desertimonas flava]|uniref:SEC-C metal-binding domain-containing protein n=1 Tax=Desertimonas flava TaxID=2064846 RepID=UPI000E342AB8|nr:SEC-C metal-binding domain-containing protein [Desertimonas flava]